MSASLVTISPPILLGSGPGPKSLENAGISNLVEILRTIRCTMRHCSFVRLPARRTLRRRRNIFSDWEVKAGPPQESKKCRFVRTELVFCACSSGRELTCDESNLCGRYLRWSGHQPNRHSVSAIHSAILWATRRVVLLWFTRRPLLRPAADESWLGLHAQSAHGLWRPLSCLANG
jgi:hypothetical protein